MELMRLPPDARRKAVSALIREGTLSEAVLAALSAQGDRPTLLHAVQEMEAVNYTGLEYHIARCELERGAPPAVRAPLLKALLQTWPHGLYTLELAAVYCALGEPEKARRLCARIKRRYPFTAGSAQAEMLEALLEIGQSAAVYAQFGNLAAPTHNGAKTASDRPRASSTEPGTPAAILPEPKEKASGPQKIQNPDVIEEAFSQIVGMATIRAQLGALYHQMRFAREREEQLGIPPQEGSCHFVLLGNPGTGKTTVARIIAKMLHQLGVRQKDSIVEVDRGALVSQYVGETALKTTQALEKARGGVLFIDEAYTLYRPENPKDSGIEAIETLLKYMEDHRGELTVILAGYEKPLLTMLHEANPGLASRFTHTITLPDYSAGELLEIAERIAFEREYTIDRSAHENLLRRFARERMLPTFANARTVRSIIEEGIAAQALRLSGQESYSKRDLILLLDEDLRGEEGSPLAARELLAELDRLTGLQTVKSQVHAMVKSLKARELDRELGIPRGRGSGTLHMAFLGNPGTGKTTVARIIAQLYAAMGLLPGGAFVECSRGELVAGYQGQTAIKVNQVVERALGGVLFIDEAYSLCSGPNDSFGREAVDALIKAMEDNRQRLMVIFAGYTDETEAFFSTNPGLRSRVPTTLHFQDYSTDELLSIFRGMVEAHGFSLPAAWEELIRPHFEEKQRSVARFSNGREVRNLVDAVLLRRDGRIADRAEAGAPFTAAEARELELSDLREGA